MTKPLLEVADVFRSLGPEFLETEGRTLSPEQRRVVRDLLLCRTAALGGHVERCDHCGHQEVAYNSCRNRHCPKCQAAARAEWMKERAAELLPVEYFHVVFTLPQQVGPLALQNKRVIYGLLFRAASETLLQIAADPKHLGAEIGFLAVLHTWGQNLSHHPHIHCVIPGGGPSTDSSRWVSCREGFFLPVQVLSRLFRGKFIAYLREAFAQDELCFHGELMFLSEADHFACWLSQLGKQEWVVYAKRPFGGAEQVLKYLARYTHRVAISNQRLVAFKDGQVTFRWKDYAHGNAQKQTTLSAVEFTRRFLLHVLPRGFVRIRHYGFLANRLRQEKLALCKRLLGENHNRQTLPGSPDESELDQRQKPEICRVCQSGRMIVVEWLEPGCAVFAGPQRPILRLDSS